MAAVADLPEHLREDFEERAAIMEYHGGLPQVEAEQKALEIVMVKRSNSRGS